MTYKDGISAFRMKYEALSHVSGNAYKEFLDTEILYLLGQVQSMIGNTYKLCEAEDTIQLVSGQSEYVAGTGATNLPDDVLSIRDIWLDTTKTPISKTSISEITANVYSSGLPTQFAVYKNFQKLYLNSIPDKSYHVTDAPDYQLHLTYIRRLDSFDPSATNTTWTDYDTDLDGVFKLPAEYHPLIVEGALADIFPNRMRAFGETLTMLVASRPRQLNSKLKYHLGV